MPTHRLHPVRPSSLGQFGAERMNPQGQLFEEFLQAHQLMAPCTFEQFHVGPTFTWTHPSGARLRRDYVLASPVAATMVVKDSFVITDHDTTFDHEDHLPVCLRVDGAVSLRAHTADRIRWDPGVCKILMWLPSFKRLWPRCHSLRGMST